MQIFSTGVSDDALMHWPSSAGWGALLEALICKQLFADSTQEITHAIKLVGQVSTCLQNPIDPAQLHTMISLFATFRKLLQPMVSPDTSQLLQLRLRMHATEQTEFPPWLHTNKQQIITGLVSTVISFNKLNSTSNVSNNGLIYTTDCTNDSSTAAISRPQAQLHTFSCDVMLHQLQANIFLTLFQMSLFYSIDDLPDLKSCRDAQRACCQLPWVTLRGLAGALFEKGGSFVPRRQQSAVWERYAVIHLQGHLTVGCCHFGCTNMDGMSEAMLRTKLCGGCRRARYCSARCQKVAWVNGGHKAVWGLNQLPTFQQCQDFIEKNPALYLLVWKY